MGESKIEIGSASDTIEIPGEICCNCASTDRVSAVESELKLARFFLMAGVEYTFKWELPYCPGCAPTASRAPVNKMHIALMVGLWTVGLFLAAVLVQTAMDSSFFAGYDFWVALGVSTLIAGAYYGMRRPSGQQTSYYQPIRICKLRQKFTSGEVTGIVLGFTNPVYSRRFCEANTAAITS